MKSPSLSSSSSSSLSSTSSRKLPTPPSLRPSRQQQTAFICDVCNTKSTFNSNLRILHSSSFPNIKVNDFDRDINLILNNLEYKTELVSKKIATIESSISSHNVVVNELKRGIANLTNELSKMSYKISTFEDFISSSSSVTLSKPSSSNVVSNTTSSSNVVLTKSSYPAYTYTSFPHIVHTSSASHNMIVKDPHRNRTTPYSRPVTSVPPLKCSLLVLGDSNTKYVKFPNINYHRVPTYLIEDINPSLCIGHAKVWLHVDINNLKSIRCGGPNDVQKAYELFIHKVDQIRRLSPNTTVIVSPILPTGVSVLNNRARVFNRLLFSTRRWFTSLDFNRFADRYKMLDKNYRCFNNPRDRIHLGYHGICELQRLIHHKVSVVDSRSYQAVAKSNIT